MSDSDHTTKRRRRVEADYHHLAKECGFTWLGPFPEKTDHKTLWCCSDGHTWQASYHMIKRGRGCPFCSRRVRKIEADYHTLSKKTDYIWHGPLPSNVNAPSLWECSNNHQWQGRYNDIRKGVGCPTCARERQSERQKLGEEAYHIAAKESGILWVGSYPQSSFHKTEWECPKGHRWFARYININHQKQGCPCCSKYKPKTPEDYHQLGMDNNLQWLGALPKTTYHVTKWCCPQDHIFSMRYSSVRSGQNCPKCAGKDRKKDSNYYALAESNGLEWLGPMVKNTATKTSWQCAKNHTFKSNYNSLSQGHGCPYCKDMVNGTLASQPQRDLCDMLGGELNHTVDRYSIDVALTRNSIQIACEYDCWYWHAGREDHDSARDDYLISEGWRVLRVKSNTQLPSPTQLNAAIQRLIDGDTYAEIVLPDWGHGSTFYG